MNKIKIYIMLTLLAIVSVLVPFQSAVADSPVTSTDFYKAYLDEEIVMKAKEAGGVTEEIAAFLADASSPLDIRAAVINAIGWDGESKGRTKTFVNYAYGTTFSDLDLPSMREDELFVIGYLLAMDDYLDTAMAEELLGNAKEGLKDSFTAAVIHAIVTSQGQMLSSSFEEVWKTVAAVAFNERMKMDMRPEAAEIIFDYLGKPKFS